ncbi:hypothetical protein Q3G72_010953 [Acer saccharum]|nr:hypothetical protein Q3G72_010953 [Acer saccharum]
MATFNFSRPKGISLLASYHDGHILGALQIDSESLNHFICNNECYYVGVDHLAGDEDSVHITACDASFQFIFRIQDSECNIPERNMALNYKDKKIAFIDRNHYKFVLLNGRNGVSIESGRENDCGPYHTKFNLKQLLLIDESICMTNRVLIYPSCRDGQPPALKCPIDPVGYIICYSL